MDRSYRILPTYTGDVSGAASALYELGGMVVIHDPSGCNSTYNTHDEIRWYDQESLIFITGLAARDAVLGNDNKLVKDVCDAAEYYRPAFIALLSSPIPYLNGTDFPALARIIEKKTGIRTFFVMTNGMHDYVRGAGNALLKIAENFVERPAGRSGKEMSDAAVSVETQIAPEGMPSQKEAGCEGIELFPDASRKPKVNILGFTPLDFAAEGAADRLRGVISRNGFDVLSCWAMGSTLDELRRSAEADVNLVVSAAGLQTAHFLEKEFGIPFVAGIPVGKFEEPLMAALSEAVRTGKSALPCRDFREGAAFASGISNQGRSFSSIISNQEPSLSSVISNREPSLSSIISNRGPSPVRKSVVIGEVVAAGSYAAAMELETGDGFQVVTSLEDSAELLRETDRFVTGEDEVREALAGAELVIGDAFYKEVCPEGCEFISVPHLAFSGRNAVRELRETQGTVLFRFT